MTVDLGPVRERYPGYRFRQRTRNNRDYITVIPAKNMSHDERYFTTMWHILQREFPKITMTSGSTFGVTGVLPTLFELIKGQPK